jgi:hypothetical protein
MTDAWQSGEQPVPVRVERRARLAPIAFGEMLALARTNCLQITMLASRTENARTLIAQCPERGSRSDSA